jgi:uncharacterized coiled-coil protein SlyX
MSRDAFETCHVCHEKSDQCLSCASYVVNGERIYYGKLINFGALNDSELRFIQRIQKQRTIAFFHNGELYIPSRQGRSVPLAIGLQWGAWQEQQKRIDELETGSLLQSNHIAELTANLKQAVAELNSRETRINLLIQKWEKDAEYADQIACEDCVQNTLNDCIEELRQVIKGDMNEQHINR